MNLKLNFESMKTGKHEFSKKKNKIIFNNKRIRDKNEESKTVSSASTYASNSYVFPLKIENKQNLFIDYTFQENKQKLYNQKNNEIIKKINANNHYYELKKTFVLNIDLILYFFNNKKSENNDKEKNEIIKILNNIKKKESQKNDIKTLIKQKCNCLISKNDNLYNYQNKIKNQINIYNIKINNKLNEINHLDSYISSLKNRFSYVDIYINQLRFILEGRKALKRNKNELIKSIEQSNQNIIKIRDNNNDIKKIKSEISEIKKDNKLYKKQNRLFKSKNPNINLIRVVEFYIRIIRAISLKNKFLNNSINSLCKTLEFLDLNQIKNFTEYKRTRQKSSYEIEFSDLENNYYEENINRNYKDKKENNIDKFMDFSEVLDM